MILNTKRLENVASYLSMSPYLPTVIMYTGRILSDTLICFLNRFTSCFPSIIIVHFGLVVGKNTPWGVEMAHIVCELI